MSPNLDTRVANDTMDLQRKALFVTLRAFIGVYGCFVAAHGRGFGTKADVVALVHALYIVVVTLRWWTLRAGLLSHAGVDPVELTRRRLDAEIRWIAFARPAMAIFLALVGAVTAFALHDPATKLGLLALLGFAGAFHFTASKSGLARAKGERAAFERIVGG